MSILALADHQQNLLVQKAHVMNFDEYAIYYDVKVSMMGADELYFAEISQIIAQPAGIKVESMNYKKLLLRVIDIYYENKNEKV